MKDHQSYELIENYLAGNLSSQEIESFNLMLESNADFAVEFEQQKMMHEIIIDDALLREKARMRNFDFKKGEFLTPNKHPNYWSLGFLTVGLGIAIGTIIFWPSTDKLSISLDDKNEILNSNKNELTVLETPTNPIKSEDTNPTFENKGVNERPATIDKSHPQIETTKQDLEVAEQDTTTSLPLIKKQAITSEKKANNTQSDTEEKVKAPCESIQIQGSVQTSQACYDEMDGSITITNARGGQAPYQYALHDGQLKREKNKFGQLAEGYYNVFVFDKNGCSQQWEDVFVEGRDCSAGKEHIFSLSREGEWSYPVEPGSTCQVTIRNKVGQVIFTDLIENGFPEAWDGRNKQLNYADPGNYPVTIQFPNDRIIVTAVTVLP